MARFEFRLKALLAFREATRAERRIDLAAAQGDQSELASQRATLQRQLNDERKRLRVSSGQVDVAAMQAAHRFESILRSQLHELSKRDRAVALEVDRLTQAVVEADREVRSLEKLREKQLEQFREREARLEAKRLDEVATRAFDSD
jgi:flagellar export protein FliJ